MNNMDEKYDEQETTKCHFDTAFKSNTWFRKNEMENTHTHYSGFRFTDDKLYVTAVNRWSVRLLPCHARYPPHPRQSSIIKIVIIVYNIIYTVADVVVVVATTAAATEAGWTDQEQARALALVRLDMCITNKTRCTLLATEEKNNIKNHVRYRHRHNLSSGHTH